MIDVVKAKNKKAVKAKNRSKKNLNSSPDRPRMVVYRSNKYIYIQIVDDINRKVLCAVSSVSKDLKEKKLGKSMKSAEVLGKEIGKKLRDLKIEKVVFDRNGYKYHGKIKALADGCRSEGINF